MRSGSALGYRLSLASGEPDASIAWAVDGTAVSTLDPPAGSVSVILTVPANLNTLTPGELLGSRLLTWEYAVAGVPVTGGHRYNLEGDLPFFASEKGVRNMLGIDNEAELPDEDVGLVRGYLQFENYVGATALATFTGASPYLQMLISEAIEAQAALRVLPTLQLRVAQSESSGTNQYSRGKLDWDKIEASLSSKVTTAAVLVNPELDPVALASGSSFLQLVTPSTDLFPDG